MHRTLYNLSNNKTFPSFSLSFGNLGSDASKTPVDLTRTSPGQTVGSPSSQCSNESTIQGLTICSPELKSGAQSPPANISSSGFSGSAVKTETSSMFGSNAFGSVLGQNSTAAPVFGSQTPPVQASAPTIFASPSLVLSQGATTTSVPTPSIFGSLTLGDSNKVSPTSPPTGLFASLVKPDQSVFAQTSPPLSGIFGSSGNQSSNVFGSQNAPVTTTSTSIFAGTNKASPGNIFSNVQQGGQGQQGSMFAQSSQMNATGGSLFSQSSFASPQQQTGATTGSSIFGGSQAAAPFGATNVFGAAQSTQPPSIFGGQSSFGSQPNTANVFGGSASVNTSSAFGASSVFGGGASFSNAFSGVGQSGFGSNAAAQASSFTQQSPTFGGGATFGSPKSNIFGQQQVVAGQQNVLFEQLGSQQSGNMFGNLAQNTQPSQAPGGFQGSAFSSWR